MADFHKRNEALTLESKDIPKISEIPEIKELSPGKSVSSDDTRESAATSFEPEKEGLPEWISEKNYFELSKQEADKELWKDLRKADEQLDGSLLDQKFIKYIFIDTETGKPYVKMPTDYHEDVVEELRASVNSQSIMTSPVLVKTDGVIKLKTDALKHPDIFIFGPDRTETNRNRTKCKKRRLNGERKPKCLNPNAIIEVSWTNKIKDEEEKFRLQMKEHNPDLSVINVGYLIKSIPKRNNMYPTDNFPDRPLVGIDVYRMEPGDEEPTMFSSWRHGKNYPDDLIITKEQLGQEDHGGGVSISFETIVDELTSLGVLWEEPGENWEGGIY